MSSRSLAALGFTLCSLLAVPRLAMPEPILLAPYSNASYLMSASYTLGGSALNDSKTVTGAISKTVNGTFAGDDFTFTASARSGGLSVLPGGGISLDAAAAVSMDYDVAGTDALRYFVRSDAASLSFFRFGNGLLDGEAGFATFVFQVEGTVQGNASGALFIDSGPASPVNPSDPLGLWSIEFISGNNCALCQIWSFDDTTDELITARIPMIWGEWTALGLDFAMVANAIRPRGQGSASADFGHTLSLIDTQLTDAEGNVVVAESVDAVSVPEPSTLAMLVAGIGGLIRVRKKSRERSRSESDQP